jgi:oligoribonuclease NrnB/cAMP/cGMP phosphodiesterase (DHH superfamily)
MMTKPLCIYHGNCDDGFAAAWAVRHALGADFFEFYPGVYQQAPPDVSGRHVLMVDFSYKRPVIMEMATKARSIVILDHHKTAAEDLAGFREPAPFEDWVDGELSRVELDDQPITALFDMNRSGAGLTWDYFHHGEPRPLFIDYIEDRDLWLKQRPGGDEFTIALRSYPQNFEVWDGLVANGPMKLVEEGAAIQRYYRLRVEELKRSAYQASIAGAPFWIANAPYFAASEVAGELAERKHGFGACYFEVSQGRWQYSLRARGDFDVSAIARKFGGGGHKGAAGFTVEAPVHDTSDWGDGR